LYKYKVDMVLKELYKQLMIYGCSMFEKVKEDY